VYSYPAPQFTADVSSPFGYTLAGFWRRFLGFFIDDILLLIIGWATLGAHHVGFATDVIGVTAITFLYNSLLIGLRRGQTIGMRVVSVRCVDQDGVTPLTYARAAKRAIFYTALLALGTFHHLYRYVNPTTANCIASFTPNSFSSCFSCRTSSTFCGSRGTREIRHCTTSSDRQS